MGPRKGKSGVDEAFKVNGILRADRSPGVYTALGAFSQQNTCVQWDSYISKKNCEPTESGDRGEEDVCTFSKQIKKIVEPCSPWIPPIGKDARPIPVLGMVQHSHNGASAFTSTEALLPPKKKK